MYRTIAPLLGFALLTAGPATGALTYYELILTTDGPYTGFGGGPAGDIFTGTFGFDEGLLGSGGPVWPYLSNNEFSLYLGIKGTEFSTAAPGTVIDDQSVRLRFDDGPLLDVFFDFTNATGDRIEVSTISGFEAKWTASEASGLTAGGDTVSVSVEFNPIQIPEPSWWTCGGIAALTLLLRRRR